MNNNQRNILYVHSSDELYGADLILLQLVEGLDKNRFRPVVVVPKDVSYEGLLTRALEDRNIKTIRLNTAVLRRKYFNPLGMIDYLFRLLKSTFNLVSIIRKEEIDIVHSNTAAVIPGAIAARLTNRPHVWHIHEIIVKPIFLARFFSWFIPRFSQRVVAVSSPTKEYLCVGDSQCEKKTIVIHNGIDLSRFVEEEGNGQVVRNEWCISPDQPLVGMIGRISHWKGQDYFLKVARLISNTHPNTRYAIVGGSFPGQESLIDDLRRQIIELDLESEVIVSGFRSDIPKVLSAFDILVLPSTLPDPFPTVVLEAMAARKPVVANAHGGCLELIENRVTGLLIEPDQPQDMADAIRFLIDNPIDLRMMGENGRKRLEKLFSLEAFETNWMILYNSLLQ